MTKAFLIAALKRAAHTAAQTALGGIGTATLVEAVPWGAVASITALATIVSLLKSVAVGVPEADRDALVRAGHAVIATRGTDDEPAAINYLAAVLGPVK